MSINRPKTALKKQKCPLDDKEIDVIPENYHHVNKCLCFMCNCGKHICPSGRSTFYPKNAFESSYKRSYSRPSITPKAEQAQILYHRNNQKMSLETEYRKKFSGFTIECVPVYQAVTPQPSYRFEGKTQYNRDFPDWGPVDYCRIKKPIQPTHDTKLKFQAKSSYKQFFQAIKPSESIKKIKSVIIKKKVNIPIESSSQRDYKKISNEYFPNREQRYIEEYTPVIYNPNQFKTTTGVTYLTSSRLNKDPNEIRRKALYNMNT